MRARVCVQWRKDDFRELNIVRPPAKTIFNVICCFKLELPDVFALFSHSPTDRPLPQDIASLTEVKTKKNYLI